MSEIAVKVENLSKVFHIGVKDRGLLSERISHSIKSLFSRNGKSEDPTEFWALRDINFEIKKGDAVGIIGKNGAGKSTLLKILSRITPPTTGKVSISGKVASLLEVGTGFHQELTGRENIFMNGAILGMKQAEIKRKFDEIVDFSGIEKFIDTPVKHYSSGMYVRLAFAVAAHLDPEILIIDEVLAVGDAEFQKKCLGKMEDVAKNQGRTVLFVSHNMTAVESLCKKSIVLKNGQVVFSGSSTEGINFYTSQFLCSEFTPKRSNSIIQSVKIEKIVECQTSQIVGYEIHLALEIATSEPFIGLDIFLKFNGIKFGFASSAYFSQEKISRNTSKVQCILGPINLAKGKYDIDIYPCVPYVKWIEEYNDAISFEINKQLGSNGFELDVHRHIGYVILPQTWKSFSQTMLTLP